MSPGASKLVGVILAAGKGTRMYPFSEKLPKPLLPVCNQPLLACQLESMRDLGITEVLIVVGHLGFAIVDALGDGSRYGVSIQYVDQKETLGMAHAVGQLEPHVDSPFMLLLGDIYFKTDDLHAMVQRVVSGEVNGCLASKIELDPEMIKRNFAIVENSEGQVTRVIEKPRYVSSRIKGCGMYVFDQHIFDAIRRTPRTAMRDEYEITDSIQIMINDGHRVFHSPVVTEDMNLTYPADVLKVNMMELKRRGLTKLIGNDTSMPDGTTIRHSVIGAGVDFSDPIEMTNSVVLPGCSVRHGGNLDHVIIYEGGTIHSEDVR